MDGRDVGACQVSVSNIKTHFETNPAITAEGLKSIVRIAPAFKDIKEKHWDALDPHQPATWRILLFGGNASNRLKDIPRAAIKIMLIIKEFKLIDLPVLEADNYPKWFAEVNARLLQGGRRDLRFIGGAINGLQYFNQIAQGLLNSETVVYNTVFTRTAPESAVSKESYEEFEQTKRHLLNTGRCRWHDIVLAREWDSYHRDAGKLFSESPTSLTSPLANLNPKVVDVKLPLLQGLAVKRGDDDFIVALVGWMFFQTSQMRVYHTDDKDTVRYFYDYLRLLYDQSELPEEFERRSKTTNSGQPK
jgi:hypothetical protein